MVCLVDPEDGRKGDTKLVRKRQIVLEQLGCVVDIMYFRLSFSKSAIRIKKTSNRKGIDVVVGINVCELIARGISRWSRIKDKPVQTWLSLAIAEYAGDRIRQVFSSYIALHFFHIRSIGLWRLASESNRVVADLIDSYTLNIGSWIKVEKRWFVKMMIREEFKRIRIMESAIDSYFAYKKRSTIVTVANADLEHIGGSGVRRQVVPVGIDIERLEDKGVQGERLKCIFFGKLNYRPNIDACRVVIDVARELSSRGMSEYIDITVAGRYVSRSLKRMLSAQGIEIISPVDDMRELVGSKDVAILPMVSGSGMQSKILEAISWGVLVLATERTARPLGLISNREYIRIESARDIVKSLVDILDGVYKVDDIRRCAHKRIEEFRWEKTCEKLISEYRL